jgi:phosphoribosyl-ATP pyrophosphohydrolase/phosphoribosyl-AMP cyclohydrolase
MNLNFEKMGGLVPAIIQDHRSGRVLMLGFMNAEAFRRTVESGHVTFYSRSRNALWTRARPRAIGCWSRKSSPIAIATRF